MADNQVPPATPPKNGPRKMDKWMYALGGAGASGVIGVILQFNGLYFTRNEGLNVKGDLAALSLKVDATKTELLTGINNVRLDMNRNFSDMMLQHQRDQAAQFRVDDKQNFEISEIKLLIPKTKPTKEN